MRRDPTVTHLWGGSKEESDGGREKERGALTGWLLNMCQCTFLSTGWQKKYIKRKHADVAHTHVASDASIHFLWPFLMHWWPSRWVVPIKSVFGQSYRITTWRSCQFIAGPHCRATSNNPLHSHPLWSKSLERVPAKKGPRTGNQKMLANEEKYVKLPNPRQAHAFVSLTLFPSL